MNIMRALAFPLVILTLTLALAVAPLQAQPLTHQPSGITLPEQIAGFTRTSYQDFEARQAGLGAGYNYNNGKGAVATVYIYTAGQTNIASGADTPSLARLREQTLRDIVEFAKGRNELTEHVSQRRLLVKAGAVNTPVLFDALVITSPGGARNTLAWLWAARGHFLKIRMTRLTDGELPASQIEAFYEFVVSSAAD
jgi:hypothetical protein